MHFKNFYRWQNIVVTLIIFKYEFAINRVLPGSTVGPTSTLLVSEIDTKVKKKNADEISIEFEANRKYCRKVVNLFHACLWQLRVKTVSGAKRKTNYFPQSKVVVTLVKKKLVSIRVIQQLLCDQLIRASSRDQEQMDIVIFFPLLFFSFLIQSYVH